MKEYKGDLWFSPELALRINKNKTKLIRIKSWSVSSTITLGNAV